MASKVLIAFYSQTGRTRQAAAELGKLIPDADLSEIKVPANTFPDDMFATNDVAKQQIANNDYPQLFGHRPDFSKYDLVLVGSPVWSGAPATPIHTFLQEMAGYTGQVASFYTDAGTPGNYDRVFKQWAGSLNVLPSHSSSQLAAWVATLLKH